jgi:dienelactone hydrolase
MAMQNTQSGHLPRLLIVLVVVLLGSASTALSDDTAFTREMLRIPTTGAGPGGLEAMLVRPAGAGRYPLALLSHGSPRSAADRRNMTPLGLLPQAMEFARRGWAAAVVMRRGFGDSAGGFAENAGPCNDPNYVAAVAAAAADLRAAIEHLAKRSDIDASRILGVGQSAGGIATVGLTADPPAGLVAAISFAGGRGSPRDGTVCREDRLVAAFGVFGKRSRTPMLWIYADNDRYFGPELAERFHTAFVSGGGRAEFIKHPAFGEDGHNLFSQGIPLWTPHVDAFLKRQKLVMRDTLLPVPMAKIAPPPQLSANGRKGFADFLGAAPHRAFAVSPKGAFGWRSGRRTVDAAKKDALERCRKYRSDCRIYAIDDAAVAPAKP